MSQNFIACDRDQAMLMPPSLLDRVAAGSSGVDDPGGG
jgi:hypothetical protein